MKENIRLFFRKAEQHEINIALLQLKQAAEMLNEKGVNQWSIWLNPDAAKINWVREVFLAGEFYFVETNTGDFAGMFRLMQQDALYWGKQEVAARYIHSLVVAPNYKRQNMGKLIMQKIEQLAIEEGIQLLRLDCIASNAVLCNYYESLGFIKRGEKQMSHSLNNLYEKLLVGIITPD